MINQRCLSLGDTCGIMPLPQKLFCGNIYSVQLEGRKFRRQHSIHNYIVDFYCASEGLIVELDGQVHLDPAAEERDRKREAVLERMGFIVLRFENKIVFDFLPSVLKDIRDHFRENRE